MDTLIAAILAGGKGERLGHLTLACPKPLVPYAGSCRMIDFSLQNCQMSNVREVLLMSKHMEIPLIRYMQEQWSDRVALNFGPYQTAVQSKSCNAMQDIHRPDERGTADALLYNRPYLDQSWAQDILVLHSDHIYNFNYRPMYAHHQATGAALTIGYQRIPRKYVKLFGMVQFDDDGNLTKFVEKPSNPTSDCVFTAVAIFNKEIMYAYLDDLSKSDWRHDISFDLIPAMIENSEKIVGYPFKDYWEDIGTIERYYNAHLRLIDNTNLMCPPVTLDGADTLTRVNTSRHQNVMMPKALMAKDFRAKHALIFPGAEIAEGVTVEHTVVLPGATLNAGETVCGAIISPNGRTVMEVGSNG